MEVNLINKIFPIALDVKSSISMREFEVVEGDNGNILLVSVTDDGTEVDLTGARVVALFSKSNGLYIQDSGTPGDGIIIDGNQVTIELSRRSYALGLVECELQIYSREDAQGVLITSAKFNFNCRESMLPDDEIENDSSYPVLCSLIDEVNDIIDRANALEDGEDAYLYIRYCDTDPSEDELAILRTTPSRYIGLSTGRSPVAPSLISAYTWYRWKGEYGDSACLHIRYSNNSPESIQPADMSETPGKYIGIYVGENEIAPVSVASYTWYQWKGEDAHIFVRYSSEDLSDLPNSTNFSTTPSTYMGVYSGNANSAPATAGEYAWTRIKGEKGDTGTEGASSYTHIRYCDRYPLDLFNPGAMTETPSAYIGVAVTSNSVAPNLLTAYSWYKWKGDENRIYIRYSPNDLSSLPNSRDFSAEPNDYIGVYSGNSMIAPLTAESYTWYRIRGETGRGEHIHIRYSHYPYDVAQSTMSTTPDDYIGIAVTESATAPDALLDYTWHKWRGEDAELAEGGEVGDALIKSASGTSWGALSASKVTLDNGDTLEEALTSTASQSDIDGINAEIADLEGFIGYTEDDIYGVEIDFNNRTFTRLAGAVGKTPGADFNDIGAFGGRYRCNLTDGGVELSAYGQTGYTETGSLTSPVVKDGTTYAVGTPVQCMVKQPKFYYKVVPLSIEKNEEREINNVFFGAASNVGTITITLNGATLDVEVEATDSGADVANKVAAARIAGWTITAIGATVVFTANKSGAKTVTFADTDSTGVTGIITRVQPGYVGKGFKMRKGRYYISMTKKAGFKLHPAFSINGVEKDFIYLSAYEGCLYDVSASAYILDNAQVADFTASTGDKLSSIANAAPVSGSTQLLSRRNCGIIAANRGGGWLQQFAATAACSQILIAVEYASMNSQSNIGSGVVAKTNGAGINPDITGGTSGSGNSSGNGMGVYGLASVSYRGEENIWGNIWKFTDGMNIYCDLANNIHELYIADHGFAESTQTSPYVNAGITLATRDGYVSALAYNESFDWLFVPAETLGDSALPVGDNYVQLSTANGHKIAMLGGRWFDSTSAGAFFWNVSYNQYANARTFGGRLVYIPA